MSLSDKMEAAFNDQITSELAASLTYLQLAAYLEAEERPGMAHWMRRQSAEEGEHAQQFIDFVVARGGRVAIGEIGARRHEFRSAVEVFEAALESERHVTGEIRALYELATDSGDLESLPILHAFLAEQVEEEATVDGILSRLRRGQDSEMVLELIDQELGGRGETD